VSKRAYVPFTHTTYPIDLRDQFATMKILKNVGLVSFSLLMKTIAAKSCVVRPHLIISHAHQLIVAQALAQVSCDAEVWPAGSPEARCTRIEYLDWTNPFSRLEAECFCGDQGKAIVEQYWSCFYERAFACPNRSRGFATSYMIWSASPKLEAGGSH
jgi:hypothetical protein